MRKANQPRNTFSGLMGKRRPGPVRAHGCKRRDRRLEGAAGAGVAAELEILPFKIGSEMLQNALPTGIAWEKVRNLSSQKS